MIVRESTQAHPATRIAVQPVLGRGDPARILPLLIGLMLIGIEMLVQGGEGKPAGDDEDYGDD